MWDADKLSFLACLENHCQGTQLLSQSRFVFSASCYKAKTVPVSGLYRQTLQKVKSLTHSLVHHIGVQLRRH